MKKIIKVLFYCMVMLVILEITVRFSFSNLQVFGKICGYSEVWWRTQWLRNKSIKAENNPCIIFNIFDSLRGWALKPNIKNMQIFGKTLNSNSKGVRGAVEYTYSKPRDKTRILVLGDSLTFGEEVSDNETYPYYLQQILPNVEVINFGVNGYGHDQMLIYLKTEGIKYKPDIVILGFVGIDIERNQLEFRDYAKPKYELVNNELILINVPVPPPPRILHQKRYKLKIVELMNILFLYRKYFIKVDINPERRDIETMHHQVDEFYLTELILDEIIKTSTRIKAIPVFIYLPQMFEIKKLMKNKEIENEQFFFSYCKNKGMHNFSLSKNYLSDKKQYINQENHDCGHLNANGHFTAAKGIAEYLLNNNLVSKD
ncbi:hypothetical protein ACFLUV_04445 [Elusimicrobiota bacterium]